MNTYKIAVEDLTKPLILDVSAEEMFEERYAKYLRDLELKAKGSVDDPKEAEKVYREIKMVLGELEKMRDGLKDKKAVDNFRLKFEGILKKYFGRKYAKEKAEEREKEGKDKEGQDETSENQLVAQPPPSMSSGPSTSTISPSALNKVYFKKIMSFTNPQLYTPEQILDEDTKKEILENYAQNAVGAVNHKHKSLKYILDIPNSEIKITDSDMVIIKIKTNEHLNVTNVIPVGMLCRIYPYHSVEFYQKYWKPIVESIGHFCIGNPPILLAVNKTTLPDVPKNCNASYVLNSWNTAKREKEKIALSFKGERPIWIFEKAPESEDTIKLAQQSTSKYVETDYLNAIVKCIDPSLKSLLNRTGAAIQVIPSTDIIEIDVDFGRGLGIVRLTEKQIEIVPLG